MGCVTSSLDNSRNDFSLQTFDLRNLFKFQNMKNKFKKFYVINNKKCENVKVIKNNNNNKIEKLSISDNDGENIVGDLKMEVKIMNSLTGVMPNTSSPILNGHHHFNFNDFMNIDEKDKNDENEDEDLSYVEWKYYLKNSQNDNYILKDISRIPEAVSGHFTPKGFPGFTCSEYCCYNYF